MLIIRLLQKEDASCYQALRLRALNVSPEAFGSTYEREAAFSRETVIERVKPSDSQFVLGAFGEEGELLGMVTFMRANGPKTQHKGNVFGMFVAPEAQGSGVG